MHGTTWMVPLPVSAPVSVSVSVHMAVAVTAVPKQPSQWYDPTDGWV